MRSSPSLAGPVTPCFKQMAGPCFEQMARPGLSEAECRGSGERGRGQATPEGHCLPPLARQRHVLSAWQHAVGAWAECGEEGGGARPGWTPSAGLFPFPAGPATPCYGRAGGRPCLHTPCTHCTSQPEVPCFFCFTLLSLWNDRFLAVMWTPLFLWLGAVKGCMSPGTCVPVSSCLPREQSWCSMHSQMLRQGARA